LNHRVTAHPEIRAFVDRLGLLCERAGLPRMAGRLLAWLTVCDPPEQSAEELMAALGASRASVSTMSQLLLRQGLIERTLAPGRRVALVRLHPEGWSVLAQLHMRLFADLAAAASSGAAAVEQAGGRRGRVRRMSELFTELAARAEPPGRDRSGRAPSR
jgi:DNA-binding MarR family transcriptional regulator